MFSVPAQYYVSNPEGNTTLTWCFRWWNDVHNRK
uniref:Uncharacterized protein n=1 Tax=Arundo donax TaxID=35708 RepID=A0A0A9AAY5_ARUDO